jgi:hypothetical protein
MQRDDRRITVAAFEAAYVLLTQPREIGKLFLRPTPLLPKAPDVLADQPAHIHAPRSADYIL